ncbi:NAD(P)/FAD-dependent oxidoreductase [Actinopolymorpha cephalotaxi]|uniref:3-phenylpropionate/trans-cinnamate dioxygenase ferredoxin reductase subunit n=1 Tax=Actinopolymorpha cephalotaxi TaxID=504797 RepID=A0ABX2S053_9ACTN|nr:FAD-dependent oxidoreductase [Actinopolymorpha cephalotaxi]NYH82661.1 3-phenylpropionate/trans-cinnamate dioxygenase ferredoxin reductase subunit [Actinopolymorpha cephalotaxi]
MERVVVVGAGLAGLRTVVGLREQGYAGELTLVGAEPRGPYDRPPLSKAILSGKSDDSALPFDPDRLRVDFRPGVRATRLRGDVVETAGPGETSGPDLDFDGLVLATGAEPVVLPGEGARYLRTHEDAHALRAALRPGATVVIVGAGWIGAEVATAARTVGCRVTVVEQAPTPVAHALPPQVGRHLAPWYAEAGADLLLDHRVAGVGPNAVQFADGTTLRADVVLVGVGVRPATGWLAGSGLELDRGVVVGADLAAGRPGVYAVGDVAARWSPRYGTRVRGEHWDDALRAPAVAVANLLGGAQTYDPVPYVWSEQFGRMVQYAGLPAAGLPVAGPSAESHAGPDLPGTRLVWRGDPAADARWSVFWLGPDARVVAVLAVDQPRDFVAGRRIAESGAAVDPGLLADPAVSVKSSVAGSAG